MGFRKIQLQCGAALFELAISIPVLFMMIGGVVELSSFMVLHLSSSRLAYEGARFAASTPGLASETDTTGYLHNSVKARVLELMERYSVPAGPGQVSVRVFDLNGEPHVEVEVALPFNSAFSRFIASDEVRSRVRVAHLYPELI